MRLRPTLPVIRLCLPSGNLQARDMKVLEPEYAQRGCDQHRVPERADADPDRTESGLYLSSTSQFSAREVVFCMF